MKKFPSLFFVVGLFLISGFLHFVALGYPREAVFDEVHFGKFTNGYLRGEYFFDIHPPLGKLAIAGAGALAGVRPTEAFENIGEHYTDYQYIWLRFLPALVGSLLAPLIYLLTFRLSKSVRASAMAGFFVAFENALLVQSKFILMDSFLLFFGFLAIYLFLNVKDFFSETKGGWSVVLGAGLAGGLAVSIKWTGIAFLGLIGLFALGILYRRMFREKHIRVRRALALLAILTVVPAVVYVTLFYFHFAFLTHPGPGNAYMTPQFRDSQQAGFPLRDFPVNFIELNREMFRANQRLSATHAYGSSWYTWPFMTRPIYYWNKDMPETQEYRRIYLLGNPFIWWLSTAVTIWFFLSFVTKNGRRALVFLSGFSPVLFLAAAYFFNYAPFTVIGRVMFLYHYFAALVVTLMITAITLDREPWFRNIALIVVVAGTMAAFLMIHPVTFGTALHEGWPRSVFWLRSWI